MRQSKRPQILEAAFRVVEREGVRAVTFEAVAAESGITKGGLLYHFPSREALLEGLHEYLAHRWEDGMQRALGGTADQAAPRERLAAYAAVSAQSTTRAELLLILEGANQPATSAPWNAVLKRWAPTPTAAELSPPELEAFIHRLAVDGLWLFDSLTTETLDPRLRQQVADYLAAYFAADEDRDEHH